MLLSGDVLINSTAYDTVVPNPSQGLLLEGGYAGQQAATNLVYDPVGSDTPTIVSAYQNEVMAQFADGTNPYRFHVDGTSISTDGGSSFTTPLPDTPLPDGPGPSYYGDGGNAILARDPTTGNIFLATTSDIGGNQHPDIQVFESTNGGQSFSAPIDATPGFSTSAALDKPWITVGSDGKLWLTFVNLRPDAQDGITIKPGIYLTSYTGTWPILNYGENLLVDTSTSQDLVHGPQVVLDKNGNPYVIYYRQSYDGTTAQIEAIWPGATQAQVLWTLNPDLSQDPTGTPDMMVATGSGIPIRAEYFPSVAYDSATNQIYVAFADRNSSGVPRVNVLAWNLNNNTVSGPQEVPIPNDPSSQGEAWNPSIAISPDGGSLFVGFYGLPDAGNDDVYVYGATGTISGSGSLTMNATQQLSSSSFQPADTPGDGIMSKLAGSPPFYYWGDNDSASANYDTFYYSHMETSSRTFDVSGTLTTYNESDVYLATVPIPYSDRLAQPSVTGYSESSGTMTLNWDKTPYEGLLHGSPNMYIEYSTPTQPWTPIVPTWPNTDPQATDGTVSLDSTNSNFSYNSTIIYYFRLRTQYPGGILGSSTYSDVQVAPGSNTVLFTGTAGDDAIVLTKDTSSNSIDFTLNGVAQTPVSIISGGSLLVLGEGGDDTITFDLSNGNFLTASNTIDNDGGSMKLDIVGTASNDTVSMLGGGSLPYIFDGTNVYVIAGSIDSLQYEDGGGNDAISVSGAVPAMVSLSPGDTTLTNSDSAPVYVVPGTGKITLDATAGATIFPASTATIGVRQIDFAAINISAGAKVVLATSAALGVYTNHANRSVAVIDAGGLNVASGGTLDMGDNDMILNYAPANRAATGAEVFDLLASGITANGDWSGTGITSSEANYDSNFGIGARAVGFMDNNDVQDTSFDGVTLPDFNQIMIKFTYYGDADLSGTFDATDVNQLIAGRSDTPGNTGWEFADFDYDGTTSSSTDQNLFFAGRDAYETYGSL